MDNLDSYLDIYYQAFFPYQIIFDWLSYGDRVKKLEDGGRSEIYTSELFSRREISMSLPNDIYVRYHSFETCEEFKNSVMSRKPHKIDIGAVFSAPPNRHKEASIQRIFRPVCKELVFDIDISDYDDVRTCCKEANICENCWIFMGIAILILQKALEEDFGFHHIIWVYSGRRGVHGWVCDSSARDLTDEARAAIVGYLTVTEGGEKMAKKVILKNSNFPALRRAHHIVNTYWGNVLESQQLLDTKLEWQKILALVPNERTRMYLSEVWGKQGDKQNSSVERWYDLENQLKDNYKMSSFKTPEQVLMEIQFQYCYPRLDSNVTKGINHLLKSPFCIHPKSGRVCVPIDYSKVIRFNPDKVVTVKLLRNLVSRTPGDRQNAAGILLVSLNGTEIVQICTCDEHDEDQSLNEFKEAKELFREFIQRRDASELQTNEEPKELLSIFTNLINFNNNNNNNRANSTLLAKNC